MLVRVLQVPHPFDGVRMLATTYGSEAEAGDSSGDDQEEGNRAQSKKHPLAHRCLDQTDWCVRRLHTCRRR